MAHERCASEGDLIGVAFGLAFMMLLLCGGAVVIAVNVPRGEPTPSQWEIEDSVNRWVEWRDDCADVRANPDKYPYGPLGFICNSEKESHWSWGWEKIESW